MFASLKNKIREETGTDLSKLTAKISSTTTQRIESLRGVSQHGSTSSINSIISSESNTNTKDDSSHDDKKRSEARLDDKDRDWKEAFREKDRRIKNLEKEKEEAYKQINILKQSLKNSEEYKQKLVEHQEDKEQIESFQIQELSKVKQLVLLRDQELAEKTQALKEANLQIQKHRAELSRLRKQEEQLSDIQHNSSTEIKAIRKNLENTESELEKNEDDGVKLRQSLESEQQTNISLKTITTRLENDLIDERSNSLNVQRTLSRVTTEKNSALLRNAEISQEMEIVKQDTRRQENETNDLLNKITQLENENLIYKEKDKKSVETELRNTISVLEEQIADKNKNIKSLQLRLADMKKTLQQELRTVSANNFYSDITSANSSAAILTASQYTVPVNRYRRSNMTVDTSADSFAGGDVNFTYLKHVIIKFLTSREYEAQHLIRAVSTLLQFTPDEEKLINDTLEWKMSWFGARPKMSLGKSSSKNPRS